MARFAAIHLRAVAALRLARSFSPTYAPWQALRFEQGFDLHEPTTFQGAVAAPWKVARPGGLEPPTPRFEVLLEAISFGFI